jgi:hypothetical protein
MAQKKEGFDLFINTDGTYELDVKGGKGKSCLTTTSDIEEALGNKTIKRTPKPEMKEKETISNVKIGR